jgi:hypothetical protein
MNETLIEIMREVGIALHGGGDPYHRLRLAKQAAKVGTAQYRLIEKLIKQDKAYLTMAVGVL